MNSRKGSPANARRPEPPHSESTKSHRRIAEAVSAPASGSAIRPKPTPPQKPTASKDYKTAIRSYRFERARAPGIIEVLNENSYVMAEYSERTGTVKWQRLVLASQREQIEKWLEDHYPRS